MRTPVRKVTYRLYPSRTQSAALSAALRLHQQLYNAALEQRIDAYRRRGVSLTYADQCHDLTTLRQECPEFATLNCSSQQVTLRRLDKAFKAFFERVKTKGAAAGFPRFKGLARFPGFGFKSHGDGWRFTPGAEWRHGKLRLQGVGTIKARGQARQSGIIKASELLHRDGAWYLSLTLECPDITRASGTGAVAFDWGTETFATLAVGEKDAPTMETVETMVPPRAAAHHRPPAGGQSQAPGLQPASQSRTPTGDGARPQRTAPSRLAAQAVVRPRQAVRPDRHGTAFGRRHDPIRQRKRGCPRQAGCSESGAEPGDPRHGSLSILVAGAVQSAGNWHRTPDRSADAPTEAVTDLSMLRHGPKEGPQRACAQVRGVRDDLAP